ncbi:hypothetical protein SAMN05216489_00435 [Streptomyces sp. 3213]|nr:hypothetical protein SAMN05216489_00435 [Streptomyces sp. 3213] [Streptomyces sp. 3213.3]
MRLPDDGRAYLVTDGERLRQGSVPDGRTIFDAPAPESTGSAVSEDGRYPRPAPQGGRQASGTPARTAR